MREIALRFRVGLSSVLDWVSRHKAGLGLEPGHGGGKPRLIKSELEPRIRAILEKHPDATLDVLKLLVQEEVGLVVSRTTMCRTMARLGITIKKNCTRRGKGKARRAEITARIPTRKVVHKSVGDDIRGRMWSEPVDDPNARMGSSRKKSDRKRAQKLG